MPSRSQIQVAIGIVIVAWMVLLLIEGVALVPSYIKPLSLAISIAYFVLLAFDRWFWRVPFVARILHCPVLRGTWKGQIKSSWIDPGTGERIEPIDVFLAIRQTYSSIFIRLLTKESSSWSLVASLDAPRDDVARASSTYQNIPGLLIQDRSRIHHGALMLEVQGNPASRLTGSYWTDRDTKGEVLMSAHVSKVCTDFTDASVIAWPSA
jgi:hypothetical protein